MIFLVFINTIIFIILSFLHFYWALGGNWGMEGVVPTFSEEGEKVFKPGLHATIAVGVIMGGFAFITIGNTGFFDESLNHSFIRYATLTIGILFFLRAIGEFKYIGFFKKVKGSLFAKNDTRYYSPLCLVIAILSFAIILLT